MGPIIDYRHAQEKSIHLYRCSLFLERLLDFPVLSLVVVDVVVVEKILFCSIVFPMERSYCILNHSQGEPALLCKQVQVAFLSNQLAPGRKSSDNHGFHRDPPERKDAAAATTSPSKNAVVVFVFPSSESFSTTSHLCIVHQTYCHV